MEQINASDSTSTLSILPGGLIREVRRLPPHLEALPPEAVAMAQGYFEHRFLHRANEVETLGYKPGQLVCVEVQAHDDGKGRETTWCPKDRLEDYLIGRLRERLAGEFGEVGEVAIEIQGGSLIGRLTVTVGDYTPRQYPVFDLLSVATEMGWLIQDLGDARLVEEIIRLNLKESVEEFMKSQGGVILPRSPRPEPVDPPALPEVFFILDKWERVIFRVRDCPEWVANPEFRRYWWADGNGSCDCNRLIYCHGDDADADGDADGWGLCLGCERFVIVDEQGRPVPGYNDGYDLADLPTGCPVRDGDWMKGEED